MSIPPQSFAEAIVTNIPQDAGSVTVTTDRGGLQLTIAKDAVYGDFNGRQIMASDNLRVGARIFAWYNTVAASSPAQVLADLSLETSSVAFMTAK